MSETKRCDKTHEDLGNAISDIIEKKKMCNTCTREVLWSLLDIFYREDLVENPKLRDEIMENVELEKEVLLENVFGEK